jgi:hypothetical protein
MVCALPSMRAPGANKNARSITPRTRQSLVIGPRLLFSREPSLDVARDGPELVDGPAATEDFPVDTSGSHYYQARRTDASPLKSSSGTEKFLFYRGVGGFEPPITATVGVDGRIDVRSLTSEPLGDVVFFENAGGIMSYQVRHADGGQVVFDRQAIDGPPSNEETAPPLAELEQILIGRGLYPKEAQAMLNTWRDTWFKEGTRIFYIVPGATIESILPLVINPKPTETVRVFVGRVELVRPL